MLLSVPSLFRNLNKQQLIVCKKVFALQTCSLHANYVKEEEYVSVPEYPPIKDLSFKAKKTYAAQDWHAEIRAVPTVEEKQIKLNMPRYYGHKVVQMCDKKMPYNVLPAMQHYTRTEFKEIPSKSLDEGKAAAIDATADIVKSIESDIKDCIAYAHILFSRQNAHTKLSIKEKDYKLGQLIVEQINRVIINALSGEFTHLRELEVDYNPRHEAAWCVGGIDPPRKVVSSKKGRDWQKDMSEDSIDRWMQYSGQPYLALRHQKPLPTMGEVTEFEQSDVANIPRYNFDPRTLGYNTGNVHVTNIPGFWPGHMAGFGFLNFCPRDFLTMRPTSYGVTDFKEAIHAQAIQSSFAWLVGLASYNGFDTYNDLTYAMNTQTVVTNGQFWSFYEYQLNTLLMHSTHIDSNAKFNYCRGTVEMQLYEDVNAEGKCIGFNDEVLAKLVKLFINKPVEQSHMELKPYLAENCSNAAEYADEKKRVFLENTFKHMVSNRARHLELPEIYLWEKIYKIDNKTRSLEARRRFFEVGINPWRRTLDQHQKQYIPRCKRELGPKDKKNKWEKTYYP